MSVLQKTVASLTLDLGEDRILLETRANIYRLDIYLPYDILPEESGAQFNRSSRVCHLVHYIQMQLHPFCFQNLSSAAIHAHFHR